MRSALADTLTGENLQAAVPHGASIGALVATLMGWLPAVIAVVPAVYYCILIYESKTVQRWVSKRRARRLARRIHAKHRQ